MSDLDIFAVDGFAFADEDENTAPDKFWKILIVDDDEEVHQVTRLVLGDFTVDRRGVELLSAYSADEARRILSMHNDIAVILLDVVMESDHAGLQLVGYIRETLKNTFVRIILRTGQPGMAPERSVVTKYDINDYKAKAELTAARLFTSVVSACRNYQGLITIELSRRGLERVIDASSSLFELRSMEEFLSGSLQQLIAILETSGDSVLCLRGRPATGDELEVNRIQAATGCYADLIGQNFDRIEAPEIRAALETAFSLKRTTFLSSGAAVFFQARGGMMSAAYLDGYRELTELDRQLAELFCRKAAIAFDNLLLFEQLRESQDATVLALAKLAEFKDRTTGAHLRRVELLTQAIAEQLYDRGRHGDELSAETVKKIGMASILHDVGKVAVPDEILLKPNKLDDAEWSIMQQHAVSGAMVLESAASRVRGQTFLSLGAEIARGHHEKFDGSGYPLGIAGDDIPLVARIVAVADVFDALMSKRPYKDGWSLEQTLSWIYEQSGAHFDPTVVEALRDVVGDEELMAELMQSYRDAAEPI